MNNQKVGTPSFPGIWDGNLVNYTNNEGKRFEIIVKENSPTKVSASVLIEVEGKFAGKHYVSSAEVKLTAIIVTLITTK